MSRFDPYADNGGSCAAVSANGFCVIAADTRQSDGYLINSRASTKMFQLTDFCFVGVTGFYADGQQLVKDYVNSNACEPDIHSLARLLSFVLYTKRFFPYYCFPILAGVDKKGNGVVYSYDPVGSFEQESFRVSGSAAQLMQPFLDSQLKTRNDLHGSNALSASDIQSFLETAFVSAAERDIHTGDELEIYCVSSSGVTRTIVSSFPQYCSIPCKVHIGKRLAQCLNPALPSGVHSKALEVYECIFNVLGPDRILDDFYIYAFGLFPFFEYCTTATKASYFDIMQKYILPNSSKLLQALPGLIASLLPGLEEEATDVFDSTMDMLLTIDRSHDHSEFIHSFVSVFCSCLEHRFRCLAFYNRRVAEKSASPMFDLESEAERNLFKQFVLAGLDDERLVVVRGTMDVVISLINLQTEYTLV